MTPSPHSQKMTRDKRFGIGTRVQWEMDGRTVTGTVARHGRDRAGIYTECEPDDKSLRDEWWVPLGCVRVHRSQLRRYELPVEQVSQRAEQSHA